MEFTKEQIRKAENVNSVDELMTIAKEEGIELSKEQAEKYFDRLNAQGKISDEDLDRIVGGKGDPKPKYEVGQTVICQTGIKADIKNRRYNNEWEYELQFCGYKGHYWYSESFIIGLA